ncbi:diguanylate cyclase (GGDEF)-like protein [Anaerosolibacter carboniphilus]|uniref:Diguanylate cyclase (GGDEF)-like protein n=1 Tax=Anaerosolibacter carboniphilus TaxID=1417629 RepID=A0A841KQV1_9FIRM|nr:sensor domain-containing diguanylate cyclase [Anaerosolibacter carboniphilus]MBB6215793.1 diguanylate cyclase (GGDEF)-like protein [Anaerosolibacter carboniphilus]
MSEKKKIGLFSRLGILILLSPFIATLLLDIWGLQSSLLFPLLTAALLGIFGLAHARALKHHYKIVDRQTQTISSITHLNEKLEKNNLIKEAMLEISNSILDIKDFDEFLNTVVKKAVQLIDKADAGSILIINNDNRLEFKAAVGYDLKGLSRISMAVEETFLYQYTQGNYAKPCIIENPMKFNQKFLAKETYTKFEDADALSLRATISAPILIDNKLYGMINVDNSQHEDAFNIHDTAIIEYLANQLSIAIKNVMLLEKTLFLSRYDGLTKVYNRHYFDELFESIYKRAKRYHESFCLCVIDLNDLKIINDMYGHQTGDLALKAFSSVLRENIRESDIIGRYGGDEFVIILLNTTAESSQEKLQQITQQLKERTLSTEDREVQVSFSYGIASFPEDASDSKELFRTADFRMYKHKLQQKTI